jgi:hypothetical protein
LESFSTFLRSLEISSFSLLLSLLRDISSSKVEEEGRSPLRAFSWPSRAQLCNTACGVDFVYGLPHAPY